MIKVEYCAVTCHWSTSTIGGSSKRYGSRNLKQYCVELGDLRSRETRGSTSYPRGTIFFVRMKAEVDHDILMEVLPKEYTPNTDV
jgi:hypothetical protein